MEKNSEVQAQEELSKNLITQPNSRREFLINLAVVAGALIGASSPFVAHHYMTKEKSAVPNLELFLNNIPQEKRKLEKRKLKYKVQQLKSNSPEKIDYESGEFDYDLKTGESVGGTIALQNPLDETIRVLFDYHVPGNSLADKFTSGLYISPLEFSILSGELKTTYFFTKPAVYPGEKKQDVTVYWAPVKNLKDETSPLIYTFPINFRFNVKDISDRKYKPNNNSPLSNLGKILENIF